MAASMMFRAVFWVILYISLMMEAVRTSETSVDNHFTRQYNPEDSCEHRGILNLDAFKGHLNHKVRRNEKGKHWLCDIWCHDIITIGVRFGQQAFHRLSMTDVQRPASKGKPCLHSRWNTKEVLSNYAGE
jgi:hypothetical protein